MGAELELAEKEKMKDKVEMICGHDMNVFINRQLIYNYPEQLFADKGIMAIEHADFDGIERLALVTGGEIVSTFGNPDKVKIGRCDLIEQVQIGDETLLKFSGVPLGEACPWSCVELPSRSSGRRREVCTTLSVSSPAPSRSRGQSSGEAAARCCWPRR